MDGIGLLDSDVTPFWKELDLRKLRGLESWRDTRAFCLRVNESPPPPLNEGCFVDSRDSDPVEEERKGAPLRWMLRI
jgi:hypothetical protein